MGARPKQPQRENRADQLVDPENPDQSEECGNDEQQLFKEPPSKSVTSGSSLLFRSWISGQFN